MINRISADFTDIVLQQHHSGFLIVTPERHVIYANNKIKQVNENKKLALLCEKQTKLIHSSLSLQLSQEKQAPFQLSQFAVTITEVEYESKRCFLIKFTEQKPEQTVTLNNKVQLGLITFTLNGDVISTNPYFDAICSKDIKHIEQLIYGKLESIVNTKKSLMGSCNWQSIKLKHMPRNRFYEYTIDCHHEHYLLQIRDVTRLTLKHQELKAQATTDPLTGLANRQVFDDRLSQSVIRAKRNQHKVGLVLIDLDDFKQINDSLGHQAGDKLLSEIANRLKTYVRKSDTIARLGGDEFCIIFEEVQSEKSVRDKLKKLSDAIAQPITLKNQRIFPKASLGACITDGEIEENEIYKRADAAMYSAKNMKRGSIKIHQLTQSYHHKSSIQDQLRQDIDYSQFELFFQPSVTPRSHNVCSIEALLRWRENGKPCLPKTFFDVIEQEGHANTIESWVIHEACRCRSNWASKRLVDNKVPVSINVSKSYFYHPNFIPHLQNEINRFGLNPGMIEVDVEESILLMSEKKAIQITKQLETLGVKIAIDHYGDSHTSLRTLHAFPISRIKLDRSLTNCTSTLNNMLVKSIIHAAQALNIEVVGEGIETPELEQFFTECNCDALQGYRISRPTKEQTLETFLHSSVMA